MNFNFRSPNDEEKSRLGSSEEGLLKIAVPHWATELKVYDTSLRPVAGIGKIKSDVNEKEDGTIQNVYQSQVSLPPGMYQVEAFLEGTTESHWIPVQPEQVTQVPEAVWKNLNFTSSAPLRETTNSREVHMAAAENWSRKETWTSPESGNSSLFLFIRTPKPERYRTTFADGLQLLSETGELITDFSTGVEKNAGQGWMAFNAKLKSGGYILRRARSGVLRRYQVIYLCDDWQTQIFLDSERFPFLQNLSVNMLRLANISNRSFQPNDKATLAAEAIFNFLRYGSNSVALFNNDRIDILLDQKTENPWLGILAAYGIAKLREDVKAEDRNRYEEYFSLLTDKVLPFLQREIPAHPDVRALLLDDNSPDAPPFSFPPMLWQSLKKVYEYSLRFENIVPKGSLTDCLRGNVIANSPWTAWRRLSRMPTFNWSKKNENLFSLAERTEESAAPQISLPPIMPKAPVYRLASFDETDFGKAQKRGRQASAAEVSQSLVNETLVIQKAKEVIKDFVLPGKLGEMPRTLQLDTAEEIDKLLGKIKPENVSKTYGLPLTQTRNCLQQLKTRAVFTAAASETLPTLPTESQKQDLFTQQAIVQFASAKFDQAALSEATFTAANEFPPLSIKEIVGQVRIEAERIFMKCDKIKKSERQIAGEVGKIVKRINQVAVELLKRADFVLITDLQGRVIFCNGAFYQLVSLPDEKSGVLSSEEILSQQKKQEKIWAEELVKAPVGAGKISSSKLPRGFRKWEIQRIPIKGDAQNLDTLYLDILHLRNSSSLNSKDLRSINAIVSELANFASLFAYGSKKNFNEYVAKLDETTTKLERAVRQE